MPYLALAFGGSALSLEVAPGHPGSLVATANGANRIDLTWTLPDSNSTVVRVERSTNSGSSFSTLIDLAAGTTSYSDTGLSASTRYDYRIQSRGGSAHSFYSFAANATTASGSAFPLAVHASGRYLVGSDSVPFFLQGDTPWSIAVQLTTTEITSYLNSIQALGFNAILFNGIEHYFSSQSPAYRTVEGYDPFTNMSPMNWTLATNYKNKLIFIVDECKARGIVCLITFAYLGYFGGSQGWNGDITTATTGQLQSWGADLATALNQGNVIWVGGGDYAGTVTERDKQWNIVTGIRSVRTTDIITAHPDEGDTDGYSKWNGYTGFNLNFAYPGQGEIYTVCQTARGRAGPMPFFSGEAVYEQERSPVISASGLRRQSYIALLEGAAGQMFGNNPRWHFESPNALYSYTGTWESSLSSTGTTQQQHVKQLIDAYAWHLLVPKTDTSFVTTSLGTGNNRIVAALASDGSFGMVWTPNVNFTVAMSTLTPSSVRGRWYNPTDGTYTTASGSPYANTGTHAFTAIGERILVLDAA